MKSVYLFGVRLTAEVFPRYRVEIGTTLDCSERGYKRFFFYKRATAFCLQVARNEAFKRFGQPVYYQVRELDTDLIPFHGSTEYGEEVHVTETTFFVDHSRLSK